MRIRIQGFDDQNCKILPLKKIFLLQFIIPRPQSTEQEMPSALKREHPALQSMTFFLVFFALVDPHQADQNQCGSIPRSDPDSQHCFVAGKGFAFS